MTKPPINVLYAQPTNRWSRNGQKIEYIVLHYVGAVSTARNNGSYYGNTPNIGASAHFFVDEKEIVSSVPLTMAAGHSGGTTPSGTVSITENGTKDVTNYASANVNVSAATAFGTHNGWKIAKFHTVSADVGNGATCTIDTGVTATRYMLICMSVQSRTTWGLQAAHFSVGAYTTAGALCLKPSTGQMYGQSTSYINGVSLSGTVLSFTVANANATVRAGEYLILYQS